MKFECTINGMTQKFTIKDCKTAVALLRYDEEYDRDLVTFCAKTRQEVLDYLNETFTSVKRI